MPLSTRAISPPNSDGLYYFHDLGELDNFLSQSCSASYRGLDYVPRIDLTAKASGGRGRLLVCHDYKGGYTESPSSLSYTFNFWSACDTFVYFSHHRVTIPPPGWSTASHRQGVKMLGTLIFESGAEEDCLRSLVGRTPDVNRQNNTNTSPSIPLSDHYAKSLAKAAKYFGFDGWLLNFECPLQGGVAQTFVLSNWIQILEKEMKRAVGEHAQVIWYDSVVFTGHLRWQDRLNNFNLPFFNASNSIFTNYTWPSHFPSLSAQYFVSIEKSLTRSKTLGDILCGVDVWGRGSHGGGGFGSYKAIEHIQPESLGLSVALFGQAWTWETEQDKEGWNWDVWWDYERGLWIGPEPRAEPDDGDKGDKKDRKQPDCEHGPFKPITSFFPHQPPPNPADLPLFITFSPGVGRNWFVNGKRVFETQLGWTDIDKQTSIGDMLWPKPRCYWEGYDQSGEVLPDVESKFSFDDAWLGGSALKLKVNSKKRAKEDTFICFRIPVNSLVLSPHVSYQARLVYKVLSPNLMVDLGLAVKVQSDIGVDTEIEMLEIEDASQENAINASDWSGTDIRFSVPADYSGDFGASVGVQLGFLLEEGTEGYDFDVLLGQICVFPTPTPKSVEPELRVMFVEYDEVKHELIWATGSTFTTPAITIVPGSYMPSDDPVPAWTLDMTKNWHPQFLYFNIYILLPFADGSFGDQEDAQFHCSTELHDGKKIALDRIAAGASPGQRVRVYVQGVTDRGKVLDNDHIGFLDMVFQ